MLWVCCTFTTPETKVMGHRPLALVLIGGIVLAENLCGTINVTLNVIGILSVRFTTAAPLRHFLLGES